MRIQGFIKNKLQTIASYIQSTYLYRIVKQKRFVLNEIIQHILLLLLFRSRQGIGVVWY